MPRGKPTPNCAECGQPRPLAHIGPPSSRGAAPLDPDVIAELRAECGVTSQAEVARQMGLSANSVGRVLRGEKVSVRVQEAARAHTRKEA